MSYDCTLCGSHLGSTVGGTLVDHPALVSFVYERGVDLSDAYLWTLAFADDGDRTVLRSTEPIRVAVTARHDDDELSLVVDDGLEVVAVEREG